MIHLTWARIVVAVLLFAGVLVLACWRAWKAGRVSGRDLGWHAGRDAGYADGHDEGLRVPAREKAARIKANRSRGARQAAITRKRNAGQAP